MDLVFSGSITDRLDFAKMFGEGRRVEVDIGSGMGRFILARAAAHPDTQFIGIERQKPRIVKIAKKAHRRGLGNIFMIRLEATYVLRYLLPEHSVSRFYLFFPDPWPKRRHAAHRVFNDDFRSLVFSRLVPGGDIQIATDSEDYFADMCSQMAGDARFERIAPVERTDDERTDFELIFRGQGLVPGEAGFRARTPDEIGADTLARYAREDAVRYERYWNVEMPHAMRIHVVGIGGVGMAALAQACIDAGHVVSGSDRQIDRGDAPRSVKALAAQGASILPQDGSGVTAATERVVVSTAIEDDNPDILAAKSLGIRIVHRSIALADIVRGKRLIAVAGTSGKSTTTAILGHLLAAGGLDPWVVNGAEVVGWGGDGRVGSVRFGEGEWCVIEADESDRSFLRYSPTHAIITNESADHFDIDETHALFDQFRKRVSGTVVEGIPADLAAEALPWGTSFMFHGSRFTIPVPGAHNAQNAWQALQLASLLGVPDDTLRDALASFPGVRRRLERVGTTKDGAIVVDDYAHNPAKLAAAISAVKDAAAGPVCVVWRPHGFTPLRHMLDALADMFVSSLGAADRLMILPVYDAGGTTDRSMNADALLREVEARGFPSAKYLSDWRLDAAHVQNILSAASGCGAILIAGARDPDLPRLCAELAAGIRV